MGSERFEKAFAKGDTDGSGTIGKFKKQRLLSDTLKKIWLKLIFRPRRSKGARKGARIELH